MVGKLPRTIVVWPISPAYSGQAVAAVLLTALIVTFATVAVLA
jgi:hypothetical protein